MENTLLIQTVLYRNRLISMEKFFSVIGPLLNDSNLSYAQLEERRHEIQKRTCCTSCREPLVIKGLNSMHGARTSIQGARRAPNPHMAHRENSPDCPLKHDHSQYALLNKVKRNPEDGKRVRERFFRPTIQGGKLLQAYQFLSKHIGDQSDGKQLHTLDLRKFEQVLALADARDIWSMSGMEPWRAAMLMTTFAEFEHRGRSSRWISTPRLDDQGVFVFSRLTRVHRTNEGQAIPLFEPERLPHRLIAEEKQFENSLFPTPDAFEEQIGRTMIEISTYSSWQPQSATFSLHYQAEEKRRQLMRTPVHF